MRSAPDSVPRHIWSVCFGSQRRVRLSLALLGAALLVTGCIFAAGGKADDIGAGRFALLLVPCASDDAGDQIDGDDDTPLAFALSLRSEPLQAGGCIAATSSTVSSHSPLFLGAPRAPPRPSPAS